MQSVAMDDSPTSSLEERFAASKSMFATDAEGTYKVRLDGTKVYLPVDNIVKSGIKYDITHKMPTEAHQPEDTTVRPNCFLEDFDVEGRTYTYSFVTERGDTVKFLTDDGINFHKYFLNTPDVTTFTPQETKK